MADNTTLNTGTGGDVIATDDIGGIKIQRVKVIIGNDGVNNGDISATNPLPITAPSAIPTTVSGSVAVTNAGITSIDTKTPALGQAAMVASTPVVIASNQTAIPVTIGVTRTIVGSFAVARPIVAGTVALQNLLSIEAVGATNVYIKRIYVAIGSDGAAVSGAPAYRVARTSTTPSAGTLLTPPKKRTSHPSDSNKSAHICAPSSSGSSSAQAIIIRKFRGSWRGSLLCN